MSNNIKFFYLLKIESSIYNILILTITTGEEENDAIWRSTHQLNKLLSLIPDHINNLKLRAQGCNVYPCLSITILERQ